MPSWHCIRALEPVRLILRRAEKVARCNWRSNLPGDLTLIHGRDMLRHKSKARGRAPWPHENGFPATVARTFISGMNHPRHHEIGLQMLIEIS